MISKRFYKSYSLVKTLSMVGFMEKMIQSSLGRLEMR